MNASILIQCIIALLSSTLIQQVLEKFSTILRISHDNSPPNVKFLEPDMEYLIALIARNLFFEFLKYYMNRNIFKQQ